MSYVFFFFRVFFFKQKTAYEIYQCDWSSDVCSSDLIQSVTARVDTKKFEKNGDNENQDGKRKMMKMKDKKGKRKEPKEVVFVVENGTAKMVEVKTGISDDNYIEIKAGLEGEEDDVSGNYKAISRELEDGSNVRVEDKDKTSRRNKN